MTTQKRKILFPLFFIVMFLSEQLVWAVLKRVAYHASFFQGLSGDSPTDIYVIYMGFGLLTLLFSAIGALFFAKFFYKKAISSPLVGGKRIATAVLTAIGAVLATSFLLFNLYDTFLVFTGPDAFSRPDMWWDYLRFIPIACQQFSNAFLHVWDAILQDCAHGAIRNFLKGFIEYSLQFYVFSAVLFGTLYGFCRLKAKTKHTG